MAAGLEVALPSRPALVELAATIPSELKLHGWTTKYILKSALTGPCRRRHPAPKARARVSIAAWLRGPLRASWSRAWPAHVRHRGLFDPTAVTRLVSDTSRVGATIARSSGPPDADAWCDHYLPHERWNLAVAAARGWAPSPSCSR